MKNILYSALILTAFSGACFDASALCTRDVPEKATTAMKGIKSSERDTNLPEVQTFLKCLNGSAKEAKAGKKISDPKFAAAAKEEMKKNQHLFRIAEIYINDLPAFMAAK
jgi:hypothetical protein